jgi:hypothetical protein
MDGEYKNVVLHELDRWTVHEADVVQLDVAGVSLTVHQAVRPSISGGIPKRFKCTLLRHQGLPVFAIVLPYELYSF